MDIGGNRVSEALVLTFFYAIAFSMAFNDYHGIGAIIGRIFGFAMVMGLSYIAVGEPKDAY